MSKYDQLTPSEKAKLTRRLNKLDDQRHATYRLQFQVYRAKEKELSKVSNPKIDEILSEENAKVAELMAQIKAIKDEAGEKIKAIRKADREACQSEFDEYMKASSLAHEWWKAEHKKTTEEFYKEVGVE